MMFSFPKRQELPEKEKSPTHQDGGFKFTGGDFVSASFLAAHRREIFVSRQGTLALHLPGCHGSFLWSQFLMLLEIVSKYGATRNGIYALGRQILRH
jgi:hypothetical protein